MESCVPPGFRFHPTDEELVGYYLRKKIASKKIDLDVIRDIDLYRIEPWDLQERCRIGYEEQNEWYFFSHKDKKYPTGTRTNRATVAGFWKATGRDKAVYDKSRLIGMRKTLVFYKGRAPTGQKTDWIIHEYRLESDENGPPREEGWVVCRAFKKRTSSQNKTIQGWDTTIFQDEPSGITSSAIFDPLADISRQTQNFKKEIIKANNLNFIDHYDQFLQLPQLESPSMPLIKKLPNTKEVTDWRDLDKFVASQLSQEIRYGGGDEGGSSFGADTNGEISDMAVLLLQCSNNGGDEEGNKLNELLSSDIGICLFDN
ncbi:hypothetical protein E1A91_D03G010700v1 [Gossypium mustelinum]|uniref:NAC domain-containing protein n=3 Tax=Gossypium TaxID=3633 RepID=A0A5D2VHG0_GOSMU|nr:hypothetical protein ES319_D03G010500v1 [Gossypium barbadense]TYG75205.1 hypothetical protein ES288_D03G011100v1 [Gossypium darwinii]TYI88834.1 hypothetical protein E1A91_D03G010700v1 [Gossypium mustelinum]TYI88835.1 hypothetical protein E1A91_D03G010700v1 [Gossypium mustelinum]TYI88836.1 hypothetical protein E1A91_D03G010700v1 [Gossypium mustelinum]